MNSNMLRRSLAELDALKRLQAETAAELDALLFAILDAPSRKTLAMTKGLTKKLDFEKSRSKARTSKPDYRNRFAHEGSNFDRGGSHGNRIALADASRVRRALAKIQSDDKLRAIAFYERQMRSRFLKVDSWKFRFKLTVKTAQELGALGAYPQVDNSGR